jgi:hypothetical protein
MAVAEMQRPASMNRRAFYHLLNDLESGSSFTGYAVTLFQCNLYNRFPGLLLGETAGHRALNASLGCLGNCKISHGPLSSLDQEGD